MTEAEWLACDDPARLIEYATSRVSPRKFRLLACACCRAVGHIFADRHMGGAIELYEQVADGELHPHEPPRLLVQLRGDFGVHFGTGAASQSRLVAEQLLFLSPETDRFSQMFTLWVSSLSTCAADHATPDPDTIRAWKPNEDPLWRSAHSAALGQQVALLRDIFGNPFRRVAVKPGWLTSDVVSLARSIRAGRAFDRLPVLADAPRDTGCENAGLLGHCRDRQLAHVHGCWAIDRLLDKERPARRVEWRQPDHYPGTPQPTSRP